MDKIEVFAYTNPGGREDNEDYCNFNIQKGKAYFVLADGLGGHEDGEIASQRAGSYLMERLGEEETTGENLSEILKDTNQWVIKGQQEYPQMRTTAAVAYIQGGYFRETHAGDSRIYLFKNGCLYFQSRDHSVVQLLAEMGEIEPEEIRFHPDRSKLLKALGDDKKLKIPENPEPILLEPNDAFLLCSDGFWEYVWETEMEIDLTKSRLPQEWASFMLKRLLNRVSGDYDNITVIAGMVRGTEMGGD